MAVYQDTSYVKFASDIEDPIGNYNQQKTGYAVLQPGLSGWSSGSLAQQATKQQQAQAGCGQLSRVSLQSETENLTLAANRIRSAVNRLSEALFGPVPEPTECNQKCEDSSESIQNNVRITSQVLNESAQSLEALFTKISNR